MHTRPVSFDPVARIYRWAEYLTCFRTLERCRFAFLPHVAGAHRALLYGDGDGRFLARLARLNPRLHADAVDSSEAMLRLAAKRVRAVGDDARDRIRLHHANALDFEPAGEYDLIVTHFFLDCLHDGEVATVADRLKGHLSPQAMWLVSEFAVPENRLLAPLARVLISVLYMSFGLLTGLRIRQLPDYAHILRGAGFTLRKERSFAGGVLRSELWRRIE